MIDDSALRVGPTHAETGVGTLVIDASTVAQTVCVEHALGPTASVRVS